MYHFDEGFTIKSVHIGMESEPGTVVTGSFSLVGVAKGPLHSYPVTTVPGSDFITTRYLVKRVQKKRAAKPALVYPKIFLTLSIRDLS